MQRLFVDTEFNGYKGDLISLALVSEDGKHEFYEVLGLSGVTIEPWVCQNVLPVLDKDPVPLRVFQQTLQRFLSQFSAVHVTADWPDDIKYLCDALIVGPGSMMNVPIVSFALDRTLAGTSSTSLVPHNALEDARALRRSFLGLPHPVRVVQPLQAFSSVQVEKT